MIETLTLDRAQTDPLRYQLIINGKLKGTKLTLAEAAVIIEKENGPDDSRND